MFVCRTPDLMNDLEAEAAQLRAENARLTALLERHGIPCPKIVSQPDPVPNAPELAPMTSLSSEEKVALFRRLFRGRADVYPVRWQSKRQSIFRTLSPRQGG